MDNICLDYNSLYPRPVIPTSNIATAARHWMRSRRYKVNDYCHCFSEKELDDGHFHFITYDDPDTTIEKSEMIVVYNDKELEKRLSSLSKETVDNNLSIVTIIDSYENIINFLNNESIILVSQTDIIPYNGSMLYWTRYSRERRGTGLVAKTNFNMSNESDTASINPFYTLYTGVLEGLPYFHKMKQVSEFEYDKELAIKTYEKIKLGRKVVGEYKVFPDRFITTVMFYSHNAIKIFSGDITSSSEETMNKFSLSCQETLAAIGIK